MGDGECVTGGFERGRRIFAEDESLRLASKLEQCEPSPNNSFDPFKTWVAPPVPEHLTYLHVVINSSVTEAMLHISRFFSLRVKADMIKQRPKKGTFSVRVFDDCVSSVIKIRLYSVAATNSTIVAFQPRDSNLQLMKNFFHRAKQFIEAQTNIQEKAQQVQLPWQQAEPNCGQEEVQNAPPSLSGFVQDLDDDTDIEIFDGFAQDEEFQMGNVPDEDDWYNCMDNCEGQMEYDAPELSAMCQIAHGYPAVDLQNLANVLSKEFLKECWGSSQAHAVAQLLKYMAQESTLATTMISKVDPSCCPKDQGCALAEFADLLVTLVSNASEISPEVRINLQNELQLCAENLQLVSQKAVFYKAFKLLEQ